MQSFDNCWFYGYGRGRAAWAFAKNFADGPHGVRKAYEQNCTAFPALCCMSSTGDTRLISKMGVALAKDCINNNVDMLLGPGVIYVGASSQDIRLEKEIVINDKSPYTLNKVGQMMIG